MTNSNISLIKSKRAAKEVETVASSCKSQNRYAKSAISNLGKFHSCGVINFIFVIIAALIFHIQSAPPRPYDGDSESKSYNEDIKDKFLNEVNERKSDGATKSKGTSHQFVTDDNHVNEKGKIDAIQFY